jgi:hypothetical protein
MIKRLEIRQDARDYQSFRFALAKSEHSIDYMIVSGYREGDRTHSPLPYYSVSWSGTGISLALISTVQTLHVDLATQTQFDIAKLRYGFYATRGEQQHNYPHLNTASLLPLAINLLQHELDFVRLDGTFFSVSMEASLNTPVPPSTCLFSFFNLHRFIYAIFTISCRDISNAPGRLAVERDLEELLERFPDRRDIGKYEETIRELQDSY